MKTLASEIQHYFLISLVSFLFVLKTKRIRNCNKIKRVKKVF